MGGRCLSGNHPPLTSPPHKLDPHFQQAVQVGCQPIVEELLRAGAGVDSRDNNGATPLHWVCEAALGEEAYLGIAGGSLWLFARHKCREYICFCIKMMWAHLPNHKQAVLLICVAGLDEHQNCVLRRDSTPGPLLLYVHDGDPHCLLGSCSGPRCCQG